MIRRLFARLLLALRERRLDVDICPTCGAQCVGVSCVHEGPRSYLWSEGEPIVPSPHVCHAADPRCVSCMQYPDEHGLCDCTVQQLEAEQVSVTDADTGEPLVGTPLTPHERALHWERVKRVHGDNLDQ